MNGTEKKIYIYRTNIKKNYETELSFFFFVLKTRL